MPITKASSETPVSCQEPRHEDGIKKRCTTRITNDHFQRDGREPDDDEADQVAVAPRPCERPLGEGAGSGMSAAASPRRTFA